MADYLPYNVMGEWLRCPKEWKPILDKEVRRNTCAISVINGLTIAYAKFGKHWYQIRYNSTVMRG